MHKQFDAIVVVRDREPVHRIAHPVLKSGDAGAWTNAQSKVMQDLSRVRARFDTNFHVGFTDECGVVKAKMMFDFQQHEVWSYTVKYSLEMAS